MLFSTEDTTTLKTLGNAAIVANNQGNQDLYDVAHQALEDFLLKLRVKYPERFKED